MREFNEPEIDPEMAAIESTPEEKSEKNRLEEWRRFGVELEPHLRSLGFREVFDSLVID